MRVPRIASNDEGSARFFLDRNKMILCCALAGCLLEGSLLKWIWKGILTASLRHQPTLSVKATYENRLKSVGMFSALPLRPIRVRLVHNRLIFSELNRNNFNENLTGEAGRQARYVKSLTRRPLAAEPARP